MNSEPIKMKAIYFKEQGQKPFFTEIPIPQPQNGQVLVKMDSAPINPSDLAFLNGSYSSNKQYPTVPGFEGSGTVMISGGGLVGWSLVGKRVAVTSSTQFGTYAEYCIADATGCFEISADVSLQQAACTFVNPLSVMAMLDIAKEAKATAVVNTAAASALGRMMIRHFQNNGIRVINVVRRDEQVEILRKEGGDLILNSNDPEFLGKLKSMCLTLHATIFFDAVGGQGTGQILENMPYGTKCYLYGGLSNQSVGSVTIGDLIFRNKSVQGFWLSDWLKGKNILSQVLFIRKLTSLLKTDLKTTIAKEVELIFNNQIKFPLEQFEEAVAYYKNNMSAGKVLLRPSAKFQQSSKPTETLQAQQEVQVQKEIDSKAVIEQEQIQQQQ